MGRIQILSDLRVYSVRLPVREVDGCRRPGFVSLTALSDEPRPFGIPTLKAILKPTKSA